MVTSGSGDVARIADAIGVNIKLYPTLANPVPKPPQACDNRWHAIAARRRIREGQVTRQAIKQSTPPRAVLPAPQQDLGASQAENDRGERRGTRSGASVE